MVAFGHLLSDLSALLSLNRVCSSSSGVCESLMLCECVKCSRVDEDDNDDDIDDIESGSCEIVPGANHKLSWLLKVWYFIMLGVLDVLMANSMALIVYMLILNAQLALYSNKGVFPHPHPHHQTQVSYAHGHLSLSGYTFSFH